MTFDLQKSYFDFHFDRGRRSEYRIFWSATPLDRELEGSRNALWQQKLITSQRAHTHSMQEFIMPRPAPNVPAYSATTNFARIILEY